MNLSLLLHIIITWFLFLPVPILNGMLREKWYLKIIGSTAAHQIGTIIISAVFILYAYISLKEKILALDTWQLLLIGVTWLLLTLAFEFGLGLATGKTWTYMLGEYKLWEGKIWLLVPLVTLASPFVVKWMVR